MWLNMMPVVVKVLSDVDENDTSVGENIESGGEYVAHDHGENDAYDHSENVASFVGENDASGSEYFVR